MGWIDRLVRASDRGEATQADAAGFESRSGILASSMRDRRRAEEDALGAAVALRWRWHDGRWERWSELDAAFVAVAPPASLVEHAASEGGPVVDAELVLLDGAWRRL